MIKFEMFHLFWFCFMNIVCSLYLQLLSGLTHHTLNAQESQVRKGSHTGECILKLLKMTHQLFPSLVPQMTVHLLSLFSYCLSGPIQLRSRYLRFWACVSFWLEYNSSTIADYKCFNFSDGEFQKAEAKNNYSPSRKPPTGNKQWEVKEEQGRKEKQTH